MAEIPPLSQPASPDRRKLLVAAGYAAANAVAIFGFGRRSSGKSQHVAAGAAETGPKVPPTVAGAPQAPPDDHVYDVVIRNGRVIDPESGFDRTANVGIDGGTIVTVSEGALKGAESLDASGKVVSPGFIDILSYEPEDKGAIFKIRDGVTTNLGMHGINADAKDFFARFTDRCLVNFGGAFDNPWIRHKHFDLKPTDTASSAQIGGMGDMLRQQLSDGWIGVDFEPEYAPGTSRAEMNGLAEIAKEHDVPCFFHGRYSAVGTNAKTLDEIINVAKDTGAAVHVEHIISTGGTYDMANSLARIDRARSAGYDVTACMYPYDFWATYLGSPRFGPGWQKNFRITYSDLQIAGTSERLTEYTFHQGQKANKLAAAYAIPEGDVVTCLQAPWVMIGSDAILTNGNNHPRATGCFSRTLGRYSRDKKTISLIEALGKMTILPAKRLEAKVPSMRKKGRIQIGADADITIFDPALIIDKSTVADPAVASVGVTYVLLQGQVVKTPDGAVDLDKHLGRPITGNFT